MPTQRQIEEQVERLCGKEGGLPLTQATLLRYLTQQERQRDFQDLESRNVLLNFQAAQGNVINKKNEQKYVGRTTKLVSELSKSLRLYYCELPIGAPDRILIQIEEPQSAQEHRYEPRISMLPPRPAVASNDRFCFVGDNVAALNYVTRKIPKLNRIEETFVRWIGRHSSLYAGSAFGDFLEQLKTHKLLYRAVLGPVTDSVVFEAGGLCETLATRSLDLPAGERSAKLYRLLHGTALMNFTLLYYFENEDEFYKQTENIEVLFGYGVHEPHEYADTTVVFRSNEPRLVNEFRELFKALRSEEFSRQIDPASPDLFRQEAWQCDVLATFRELPTGEIVRRTQASGTGASWKGDQGKQAASGERDVYRPGRPHVKICVSALKLLDNDDFVDALRDALGRGVQVSITLWEPGPFLTARIKAAKISPDAAEREIQGAWLAALSLGPDENLFLRRCTGELNSVSIIWIDDLICFSPYWTGKNVARGPHFLVAADSVTGRWLQGQYEQMLAIAKSES